MALDILLPHAMIESTHRIIKAATMQTREHALQILDRLLKQARDAQFSCVAIKAKTIANIMQAETGDRNHAMPTACAALRERFHSGKDFFRRGKERQLWSTEIDGHETSTFEVLFEIHR
jgi:hypothetical protein